jgi:HlyD family secretion protein
MANTKKRRKIVVFLAIVLALAGLAAFAIFHKREVIITVQTEKVSRRNLTEVVSSNGRIQPVLQVKISPEVSGEITELPVKEGQCVKKGDLILKIKPDFYTAQRGQAQAGYESALAGQATAEANLRKAEAEFKRNQDLFAIKLISDSVFDEVKAAYDVAKAQLASSQHQVESAHASLMSAQDALDKTTIVSPLAGTISKLDSRLGERVVGTATMAGTEVMTIADLNEMEARVDIGETDVVLIEPGQNVRLEVDAFKDRKFSGTVTEIANSSKTSMSSSSQEATKFEVKIRIKEKEAFRPGMSVTAEIETRSRTNVLAVPLTSVTARLPKTNNVKSNIVASVSAPTNAAAKSTNTVASMDPPATSGTNLAKADKQLVKPLEVVFLAEGDKAKMVPVKLGIYDENYYEITEGLQEGQEIISGGYLAIGRDLEDGKHIKRGLATGEKGKEGESKK